MGDDITRDPTFLVCQYRDSLTTEPIQFDDTYLPSWYIPDNYDRTFENAQFSNTFDIPNLDPIYCNVEQYDELIKSKSTFPYLFEVGGVFSEGLFYSVRNDANPFEKIGNSIFMNRAAIKLANIDALYSLTNHVTGNIDRQTYGSFTFCDIAAGPGGFTQYLQFRLPQSIGYGMTLRTGTNNLDWKTDFLDIARFNIYNGDDNTGSLYNNYDSFPNYVLEQQNEGVDLVTGDGGFDIEIPSDNNGDDNNGDAHNAQEYLSTKLILCEIYVALRCLKPGGSMVIKMFSTVTLPSAQLLYITSLCFEKMTLFKPISSRPANAEQYLICRNRRNTDDIIDVIAWIGHIIDNIVVSDNDTVISNNDTVISNNDTVISNNDAVISNNDAVISNNDTVISLFDMTLPESFEQWLIESNDYAIKCQRIAVDNIFTLRTQSQDLVLPQINTDKCLLVWNLPETPINKDSIFSKFTNTFNPTAQNAQNVGRGRGIGGRGIGRGGRGGTGRGGAGRGGGRGWGMAGRGWGAGNIA